MTTQAQLELVEGKDYDVIIPEHSLRYIGVRTGSHQFARFDNDRRTFIRVLSIKDVICHDNVILSASSSYPSDILGVTDRRFPELSTKLKGASR